MIEALHESETLINIREQFIRELSISSVTFVALVLQEDIKQQLMKERSCLTARFTRSRYQIGTLEFAHSNSP